MSRVDPWNVHPGCSGEQLRGEKCGIERATEADDAIYVHPLDAPTFTLIVLAAGCPIVNRAETRHDNQMPSSELPSEPTCPPSAFAPSPPVNLCYATLTPTTRPLCPVAPSRSTCSAMPGTSATLLMMPALAAAQLPHILYDSPVPPPHPHAFPFALLRLASVGSPRGPACPAKERPALGRPRAGRPAAGPWSGVQPRRAGRPAMGPLRGR
eukprot:gene6107-5960_t